MIAIDLMPSRLHKLLNVSVHTMVALIAVFSSVPFLQKIIVLVFCVGSYYFAELKRLLSASYKQLILSPEKIRLCDASGRVREVALRGEILSSPWLIILNFDEVAAEKIPLKNNISVLLFKDAMSGDAWRKLRIKLRTLPKIEALRQ